MREDIATERIERGRVIGVADAQDDVLDACLGEPPEALDELVGARAP